MKAAMLYEYDEKMNVELKLEEVPEPTIKSPNDVIVRVGAAGLCRTDLHIIEGVWRNTMDPHNELLPYITAMRTGYPRLTLPIEMLHGDADTTVPLDVHARRFAREVPSAHLVVLPGAGHMLHHTHVAAVIEAIHAARRRAGL